ncbi:MAG: polyphosphate kinase [Lewinella sp.]|nr:polyphosphate kinase [Lewinella sp.]
MPTARIRLSDYDTRAPKDLDRDKAEKITKDRVKKIADLHQTLIAEAKHSVLIILQGMDASGKDGAMRKVFGECAPYGLRTYSFKKPTDLEFAHDFLWRIHRHVPAKGEMVIFNRSHYEDILIQRVHGWIDETRVQQRMAAINTFEDLLQFDGNTVILKFYLHISQDQQKEELNQRLTNADKYWKHNDNDWNEREHWDSYMRCYEDVLNWSKLPWHIVPVDQRWYRDYVMSGIVLETLEQLNMSYPPLETTKFAAKKGK